MLSSHKISTYILKYQLGSLLVLKKHKTKNFSNKNNKNNSIQPAMKHNYTANVNRQTTDKLLFSYAIITGKNV